MSMQEQFDILHANVSSSVFGETYSSNVIDVLRTTKKFNTILGKAEYGTSQNFPSHDLGQQLKQVAKLINANVELGHERAVYVVSTGGWDTHARTKERFLDHLTVCIQYVGPPQPWSWIGL